MNASDVVEVIKHRLDAPRQWLPVVGEVVSIALSPADWHALIDERVYAEHLRSVATKMRDEYRKEFCSAQAEAEKWPNHIDGFDTDEAVDAAYLELDALLKTRESEIGQRQLESTTEGDASNPGDTQPTTSAASARGESIESGVAPCKAGIQSGPSTTFRCKCDDALGESCELCHPLGSGLMAAAKSNPVPAVVPGNGDALALLREWLDTEIDPEDEEYGPWMEGFTTRVEAALAQTIPEENSGNG